MCHFEKLVDSSKFKQKRVNELFFLIANYQLLTGEFANSQDSHLRCVSLKDKVSGYGISMECLK